MVKRRTLKNEKNGSRASRFVWRIVFVLFLGTIIYSFFFSPWLLVAKVEVNDLENMEKEAILDNLNAYLGGKYWGVIEKRNILLFRSAMIERALLASYPGLEKIEIKKYLPDKIGVAIKERELGIILKSDGEDLAIDYNGVAYDKVDLNNLAKEMENVLVLHDQSEKKADLGNSIINKDYIEYLIRVRERLNDEFGVEIQKQIETPSIVSTDVRFFASGGWRIFFDQSISLDKELEMLKVVLENKVPPEKREELEYVDLRLDNKVYYKFKDGTQIDSEIKPEEISSEAVTAPVKEETKKDKKKDKK